MLFQVPARVRPPGWPPVIPLPHSDRRTGRLDALEIAAIREDAAKAYRDMTTARLTGRIAPTPRTPMAAMIHRWMTSPEWRLLTPKTRKGYDFYAVRVMAWSRECGHPDPRLMSQPAVRSFLANFDKTPTTRKHVAKVLRIIMGEAIALGWRTDNPVQGIRIRLPKAPKLDVWEQSDVDAYSAAATRQGRHSIAAMILLEWEIGQRLTDVQEFRVGADYEPERGVFSFAQSKTGARVTIAVSPTLRGVLAELSRDDGDFLFQDEATGKAFNTYRLSHEFRRVRDAVEKAGGRALVLRQLRHSCVVQLARAGCTVPEIASITGHTFGSVNGILSTYLPRDGTVARNAQIKRGLISPEKEGPGA